MKSLQIEDKSKTKQAKFQIRFIWWALGLAIFVGFALGAHVASIIGLNLPLGKGFYSFIQIHGHVQLIGWAGLFIIAISLHFIPRLVGVPISQPKRIEQVLWFIATGLILRSLGHTILPYLTESAYLIPLLWMVATSGVIEWFGVLIYLVILIQTLKGVADLNKRPALQSVKPFFAMMLFGWFFYPTLNLILLFQMTLSKTVVLNQAWNEFAIQLFTGLVLLPVAFAFSIRMFPLYLRLPAPDWPVRGLAYAYLISFSIQILPTLPPILSLESQAPLYISSLGKILKGSVIIWFVWKLDILTRRRDPWTVQRKLHPDPDRRPTREGMPDYGEFGRFERLLYAAYIWLIGGAIIEILIGAASLMGWSIPISSDALRHIYLLGFITHLILGMAVRMMPGFIKKKKVASTKLVDLTFWLGNSTAVCRVAPLLLPAILLEAIPGAIFLTQSLFAFSGILALLAVSCLAVNLIRTAKMKNWQ
ncbi:MAG: hypothetical protein ACE5JB_12690 [bacterium]